MAVKITDLPTAQSIADSDYLLMDDGEETKKVTKSTLLNNVGKIDDVKVDGTTVVTNKVANIDLSGKQNKTDNDLTTTSKTVVGGINELKSDIVSLKSLGLKVINGYICQE